MTSAAGKLGPYSQPGAAGPATGPALVLPGAGQTGSEVVRSRIALRVRLASMLPGDRLPDIGVLAEELGISEVTVRRALEGMCQDGLLDRRRGRSGGTFVSADWTAVVSLLHDPDEAAAFKDFHTLLECGLVARASGDLPGTALDGLRDLVAQMDKVHDAGRLAQLEIRFHLDLAEVLGGPAIHGLVADLLGRLCLLEDAPDGELLRDRNRCHGELLAQLGRGATDAAVRAVKDHGRTPGA